MATEVKTYDPAQIALVVGGFLVTGFEPGTFVTVVRSVSNYGWTVGPDGVEGIRTKLNDKSALMTITLRQTSPANFVLSNFANKDETEGNAVVPVSLADANSPDTEFVSAKGWIEKPADANYAETPQGRAWQIRLAEVPMVHGGTPSTEALAETLT